MADAVFQIFDGSGNEIMNLASAPGRVVGSVDTGTANGSVTVAEYGQGIGIPWFVCLPAGAGLVPTIAINGTTLSWTFPSGNNYTGPVACIIIYGVY